MFDPEFQCIEVPKHLSHMINQENWDWINHMTALLYGYQLANNPYENYMAVIKPWMIRGYWLISYFLNPSEDNFNFMREQLYLHRIFTEQDNLKYLEFVQDIKSRVHKC